jgi:hypothetical protein
MKAAATALQWLVRVSGLIQVALGLLFWSGNALALIPVHMLVGLLLVLMLWALAALGAVAGVHPGRVALAAVWGLIVPALGVTQTGLLAGDLHWVIQVLHLLVGVAAIGQAEALAVRIKARTSAGRTAAAGAALAGEAR